MAHHERNPRMTCAECDGSGEHAIYHGPGNSQVIPCPACNGRGWNRVRDSVRLPTIIQRPLNWLSVVLVLVIIAWIVGLL